MTSPAELPLRDIHMPEAISWWPPAPGWWAVVAVVLICGIAVWYWQQRRRRVRYSAITLARAELSVLSRQYAAQEDPVMLARDLSALLRRLSISVFPRSTAASLTGAAWLQFLDQPLTNAPFSTGAGRILIDAPYRPEVKREPLEPLFTLCGAWIDAVAVLERKRAA